jgi:serine/threonine protein kinase
LTRAGYIHRDIKVSWFAFYWSQYYFQPANYACGIGEKKHTIYLLDFGIARRIVNDENVLKTPRIYVGFKGTVRFASMNCHRNMEMGPKDDCESWLYMLLDMIVSAGLPWRKCTVGYLLNLAV